MLRTNARAFRGGIVVAIMVTTNRALRTECSTPTRRQLWTRRRKHAFGAESALPFASCSKDHACGSSAAIPCSGSRSVRGLQRRERHLLVDIAARAWLACCMDRSWCLVAWCLVVGVSSCDDDGEPTSAAAGGGTPPVVASSYQCAAATDGESGYGVSTFLADHPKGCCDSDDRVWAVRQEGQGAIEIGSDDCADPECRGSECTKVCSWLESAGRYGCSDLVSTGVADPEGTYSRSCQFPIEGDCGAANAPKELSNNTGAGGSVSSGNGPGPTSGAGGAGGTPSGSGGSPSGSGGSPSGSGGSPSGSGGSPSGSGGSGGA